MLTETCIFCGSTFKIPEEYQGRKIKCPKCRELLGIATRRDAPAPAAQAGGPEPAEAREPATVVAQTVSAALAAETDPALRFEGEDLVLEARPSAAALGLRLALLVASMIASVVGALFTPSMWQTIVSVLGCLLLGGAVGVQLWLRWDRERYVLTASRAIRQSGVVRRRVRSCPLEQVAAVDFKQGPLQRLLGIGTVVIGTSSRFGRVVWSDTDDPQGVARLVAQHVDHRYAFLAETKDAQRKQ